MDIIRDIYTQLYIQPYKTYSGSIFRKMNSNRSTNREIDKEIKNRSIEKAMNREKCLSIFGQKELSGNIAIHPAKNSILLVVIASLLTQEELIIDDYVDIIDLKHMLNLLREIGVIVSVVSEKIAAEKVNSEKFTPKDFIDVQGAGSQNTKKTKIVMKKSNTSGDSNLLDFTILQNPILEESSIKSMKQQLSTVQQNLKKRLEKTKESLKSYIENYFDNPLEVYIFSDIASKIRTSILLWGAMLANGNSFVIKLPGGCNLGTRAYDMHIDALCKMGAKIEEKSIEGEDYLFASVPNANDRNSISSKNGRNDKNNRNARLQGIQYHFRQVSVTGTANITMAACLANGVTTLHNIAIEPEIINLIELLKKMGAKIDFISERSIQIHGCKKLSGAKHNVILDRIEAGTYLIAGAILGNNLKVHVSTELVKATVKVLKSAGVNLDCREDYIIVNKSKIQPIDVCTGPYPEFSTDLQPQLTAMLTLANGRSRIRETMFDNRFCHADELNKAGAQISIDGEYLIIDGVNELRASFLNSYALRGAAASVLGALFANGNSYVFGIDKLYRGYGGIVKKLNACGASVKECFREDFHQES